jgi:hypothetical protein
MLIEYPVQTNDITTPTLTEVGVLNHPYYHLPNLPNHRHPTDKRKSYRFPY